MQANYRSLLPIDDRVFFDASGAWQGKIVGEPRPGGSDRLCYSLQFESEGRNTRNLKLWLSGAGLHRDSDQLYKCAIYLVVESWLEAGSPQDELYLYGR
jgi:hypothetical protein